MRLIAFALLFFGSCLLALWRGDQELRLTSGALLIAGLLSAWAGAAADLEWRNVDVATFAIDTVLLALLLRTALTTLRWWPLTIAGLQVGAVSGHLLRAINPQMAGWLYWLSGAIWSWSIHLVLLTATAVHITRRHRR